MATADTARVLWTSPEEVRNKSFMDWLAAHTSFCKPLHHWEGMVTLSDDCLELHGRHKRSREERRLTLRPRDITGVRLGFDDVYTRFQDRSLGLTFKPLRLDLGSGKSPQKALYLIVDFVRWRRGSDNKRWCEKLTTWKERQEETESDAMG